MAKTPISFLLMRRITQTSKNPKHIFSYPFKFNLFQNLFLKPYSTSSPQPDPPNPSSLSGRMSFVFDQIDAIERERAQKDETLQKIRAWRLSKNTEHPQRQRLETVSTRNSETLSSKSEGLESGVEDNGDSSLNLEPESNGFEVKKKTEVELVHPWPEWIELMERLVQQNYFDHRRKDEDKMVRELGFDTHELGNEYNVADDVGIDFRDFRAVLNACVNFGKDRFDILRSLKRKDIQVLVGYGCPSTDRKLVFSAKVLRKLVHLDEGDVCSNCSLRSSCEKGFLLTNKEDEARTVDVMRVLLTYAFDPINGSVTNRPLLKQKSIRTMARKLLHEVVKLSAVPIDPNLPPPVIKRPPPKVKQPPPTPKRRVGRDDIEMKKGDWICPKCDFMNFAKNRVCLQCDAKQPKKQLLPGEWECPECNFLNYRRNMACFHCDCKRPPDEFTENKMEEKQQRGHGRLEKVDRSEVSNAWNFNFDDDESDGADVAAFEYADPAAMNRENLDAPPQGGNLSDFDNDFSRTGRIPNREYSDRSDHRPGGTGFDDFDDEDDDVDSYEIDTENSSPQLKESRNSFSRQGFSELEMGEESDEDFQTHSRKSPPLYTKPSNHAQKMAPFPGSEDDERSVNPKWKSSHVADARHTNRSGRGPKGLSRLSYGSDEEIALDSDGEDDFDEDFRSSKRKGNKQGSSANSYGRNIMEAGRRHENENSRGRGGYDLGRRDHGRSSGRRSSWDDDDLGRRDHGRSSSRRSSWDDDFDRSSSSSSGGNRRFCSNDRSGNFDRSSSNSGNRRFNSNDRSGKRMNSSRGGNSQNFKGGPKQEGFRIRQQGRSRDYNMDKEKDFGEFRNSRRVIER